MASKKEIRDMIVLWETRKNHSESLAWAVMMSIVISFLINIYYNEIFISSSRAFKYFNLICLLIIVILFFLISGNAYLYNTKKLKYWKERLIK